MNETVNKTPAQTPATTPVVNNGIKSVPVGQKIFPKALDSPALLIELDSKGADLFFDGREDFVVLSETEVRTLSAVNRTRYSQAETLHKAWTEGKKDQVLEDFLVQGQFTGSAGDKINGITAQNGLEVRWMRPDRLSEGLAKGWRLATPDEVRSFVKPTGGHVEIGQLGVSELIAMVRPVELSKAARKQKDQKVLDKLGSYKKAGEATVKALRRKDEDFQDIE